MLMSSAEIKVPQVGQNSCIGDENPLFAGSPFEDQSILRTFQVCVLNADKVKLRQAPPKPTDDVPVPVPFLA